MSTPQADRAAIRARLERTSHRAADSHFVLYRHQVVALLADIERLEQELKHSREAELSLSASHSSALTAVELQRRAEARADAIAQQVETLRAALAKIAAGKSLTHPDCPLPSDEAIDIAEAALGAQA